MHEPWIPHFGNHVPYTTVEEDEVERLRKALDLAEAKVKKDDE